MATQYRCGLCGAYFENGHRLQRHMEETHTQEVYTCPTCGIKFEGRADLEVHNREVHKVGAP